MENRTLEKLPRSPEQCAEISITIAEEEASIFVGYRQFLPQVQTSICLCVAPTLGETWVYQCRWTWFISTLGIMD
jgi:hypothetical protein